MKSLEKKSELSMDECSMGNFPQLYVDDEQMPEIVDWEVDKKYTLKVVVQMKTQNTHTDIDGTDTNAYFDITSYEVA